jgi:hypothetical protein
VAITPLPPEDEHEDGSGQGQGQRYLPGCSPVETEAAAAAARPEVYRCAVVFKAAIRQFKLTRDEAEAAMEQALHGRA